MRQALSALSHALFLGTRALRSTPTMTLVIVLGITVATSLPVLTYSLGAQLERGLMARARATPLVIGAAGSELDLVLAALYFTAHPGGDIPEKERRALTRGRTIPLRLGAQAMGWPIVGTSLRYFEHRALSLATGRWPAVLGEAVLGSDVASSLGLVPGQRLQPAPKDLYNLSASYPVPLQVVGLLAPTFGPDDRAIFVDVKTTWALEGHIHGHTEGLALEAPSEVVATADLTTANLSTFHLHGDPTTLPLSAIIYLPEDERAANLTLGDLAQSPLFQGVQPTQVLEALLELFLRIGALVQAYLLLVLLSTGAFVFVILNLALRVRSREFTLMAALGGSRRRLLLYKGTELCLILLLTTCLTALLLFGASQAMRNEALLRWLLLHP